MKGALLQRVHSSYDPAMQIILSAKGIKVHKTTDGEYTCYYSNTYIAAHQVFDIGFQLAIAIHNLKK